MLIRVQERLLFVLRGLAPPPRDADAFQRVLATFNYEDLLIHNFLDAFDARQIQRVKNLAKRLDVFDKKLNGRAAKLGLRVCAQP